MINVDSQGVEKTAECIKSCLCTRNNELPIFDRNIRITSDYPGRKERKGNGTGRNVYLI